MQEDPQNTGPAPPVKNFRNTIGSIVSWTILRAAIVLVGSWILSEFMFTNNAGYTIWWAVTALAVYAVVIHPTQIQYNIFKEETRLVMDGTLCSSCKHFEPTGVMCSKLDEHVTEDYLPCEGELWEPRSALPEDDID